MNIFLFIIWRSIQTQRAYTPPENLEEKVLFIVRRVYGKEMDLQDVDLDKDRRKKFTVSTSRVLIFMLALLWRHEKKGSKCICSSCIMILICNSNPKTNTNNLIWNLTKSLLLNNETSARNYIYVYYTCIRKRNQWSYFVDEGLSFVVVVAHFSGWGSFIVQIIYSNMHKRNICTSWDNKRNIQGLLTRKQTSFKSFSAIMLSVVYFIRLDMISFLNACIYFR
jgi:hypothetical protein